MQTKKLQVLLLAAALLTTGVATESAVDPAATLETQQFTCVANLSVPDANLSGVVSFLTVTNCSVLLSNLQVSFNLRGDPMAFNGNYYADLRHNGKIAVLLNRVGRPEWFGFGYSDNGFDVVFDDHATNGDIHVYRTVVTPDLDPLTGVWAPDGRTNDVRTVVADDPRVSLLNSFVGEDPNGTWMLFVADVGAGGNGNLVSWGITVTGPRNPDAPFFTINPQDQQAPLGQDIVLQISLTGKDPIQMNWCKDGLPLSDDERNTVTTNQTLRIHNALLSDSGLYRAIASNEWGVVTSQVALVTVVPPPEFQWQPQSVTTNSGALAVFAAGISGTPPVGFQWFFNGTLLANATNQSLVFINVQSAQAGNYYLKVSNLGGSVTSQVVTLSLLYSLVTHGTEGGAIERHPDAPFYSSGSTVELLARPESNYVFTGWSGDLSGLSNPATLTLDSNKDVSAQFKRLCRLTVMVEGQGAIARDPAGDSFPEGQTVSLTAQPDAGWQFVECNGGISGSQNPGVVTLNSDQEVRAVFRQLFRINAAVIGQGDVALEPLQTNFLAAETVIAIATAAAGYRFAGWSGDIAGTNRTVSILVASNTLFSALFVPVLDAISNQFVDEEVLLSCRVTGTNGPPATFVFSLESGAPEGATISTNGVFTWTPTERQGPSTNTITVKVSDHDYPILSVTNSFVVMVNEVNRPPQLMVPSDRIIEVLETLTVTNGATDSDWPANTLTFTLVSAPLGVHLAADTGVLTWTPSAVQQGSSNTMVVKVTDDGQPPLSATNEFKVVVKVVPAPAPNIMGVSRDSAGLVTLRWQSVAGRRYRVETCDRLAKTGWVMLREIQATDVLSEMTDSTVGLTERYYRIVLIPESGS